MLNSRGVCRVLVAALFIGCQVQGFTTSPQFPISRETQTPWRRRPNVGLIPSPASTFHAMSKDDNGKTEKSAPILKRLLRRVPFRKRLLRKAKPISFAILTLLSLDKMGPTLGGNPQTFRPNAAHASAPLPIIPKIDAHDMEDDEIQQRDKDIFAQTQREAKEFQHKALQIQEKYGSEARKQFEEDYQKEKAQQALEKAAGLRTLKLELLRKGISPDYDIEGERQIMLYTKGIDLAEVSGTRFYVEKVNQVRSPQKSFAYEKRRHRFILRCRVDDKERRGIDPVQYYEENKKEMARILDMSPRKAMEMEQQYKENLAKYGQITVPVEGEKIMSREEFDAMVEGSADSGAALGKVAAKEKAKEEKAAAKAAEKEAKAKAKEEKAAAKAKAKEEKAAAKAQAKEEKAAAKAKAKEEARAAKAAAAAAAATTAGAAAQAAGDVANAGVDVVTTSTEATPPVETTDGSTTETPVVEGADEGVETQAPVGEKAVEKVSKKKSGSNLPIIPVATFVVAAGGGGYAFKVYREKAAIAEEERQRQFKLIMGEGIDTPVDGDKKGPSWSAPALEEVDPDLSDMKKKKKASDTGSAKSSKDVPPQPVAEPPKKRKLGIKSMFSKKTNNRETDLNVLLSPSATAPEFASLLAKVLTFGAPGRFPQVVLLPGGMPLEEFELDKAKEMLIEARASGGLTEEQSAEVFANVVNCMLIDIVDLASSTLKEKDKKITVNAINVVVDFMNHAASLYDAVAPGVTITPVTYGGTLGRGKLEQMFEAYATSPEADDGQLTLLQGVFDISDKKMEGIMAKEMRKKIMDMVKGMKDGEPNPELEEMMKAMGGMEGMGMGGMEGMEPSPEEAKQMLKALKDMKEAGLLPKEELEQVRKEFKESFGAGIDELMDKAKDEEENLTAEEKELMDLMKVILED